MSFTITQTPEFIQAVNNPMRVGVSNSTYQIGQLFYCDIWTITDKDMQNAATPKTTGTLLTTRIVNGPGDGTAVFDISSALGTLFTADIYTTPPRLNPLQAQKNESGYVGYFLKLGFITYNAQNQQVKNQEYESPYVQWAVRAALPLLPTPSNNGNSGDMRGYCYRHDDSPVQYATALPEATKRNRSEDTLLPFFCAYPDGASGAALTVQADLLFADGTQDLGYLLSTTDMTSGGLYIINAYPGQLTTHLKYDQLISYSVTVYYADDLTPAPAPVTQPRRIRVSKDIPFPNQVLFMNRLGGWDSIQVRKDTDSAIKFKSSSFTNSFSSRNYYIDATTSITYYSSYLTEPEFVWLKDLKTSPVIFVNGVYVLQQDGDFKLDTSLGLFNYELTVSPEYDENAIRL